MFSDTKVGLWHKMFNYYSMPNEHHSQLLNVIGRFHDTKTFLSVISKSLNIMRTTDSLVGNWSIQPKMLYHNEAVNHTK